MAGDGAAAGAGRGPEDGRSRGGGVRHPAAPLRVRCVSV